MADILGLHGYNRSVSAVNKLFAVFGNDIVDVDTGAGYQQNLTPGYNSEFATYLDYCFQANGINATRSFNGTSWSTAGMRNHAPIFKYLKPNGVRLYGAYPTINGTSFPSRVWFTDNPYNYDARWGIEWGSSMDQTAGSAIVTADGTYFKTYGIKSGDPLFITSGANAGQYTVYSVDSNNQLTLTENLVSTVSNSNFYVGSNYFDVKTENNDYLRGLGVNSNRLLCFKLFSLHRYTGSSLVQVPKAPGTSSHRSIIDDPIGDCYYFHGSEKSLTGMYRYDGTQSVNIIKGIQPYIDGIDPSNYASVVGWREGEWIRMYVGTITNSQRGISVSNAVISYNENNNAVSVDPITKTPKCSTSFMESGSNKIFFGDSSGEIFQTPSGYDFDGEPIPWAMETGPHYFIDSEVLCKVTRIQIIARDGRGIGVRYKLYDDGHGNIDDVWHPIGELINDKTELIVPVSHQRASGINIRLEETGTRENTQYIEKITVYYLADNTTFV
jgi:hypothetical protein